MRNEFQELKDYLWTNLPDSIWDEASNLLNKLENKIDEVEKRIGCAVRSARDINQFVSKYTEDVDNHQPINMSVDDHDFILNRSNDVDIALDLGDNMCVSDNWYNLFSPKESEETYPIVNCLDCGHPQPLLEENIHVDSVSRYMVCEQCENQFNIDDEPKPIAVGNIEYDFPEEVYTIGNADNSEIIGDIYGSEFVRLDRLGVIFCEGDDGFKFGKANYMVKDNAFIPLVVANQIDLSKVPIKNEEPPTMLCGDSDKHKIVNNIISQLKAIDVDGETMEYILKQVGMDEQMFRQLFERQG